jgi:hypothetical protein
VCEEAIFFETPSELRAWLEEHHATGTVAVPCRRYTKLL